MSLINDLQLNVRIVDSMTQYTDRMINERRQRKALKLYLK